MCWWLSRRWSGERWVEGRGCGDGVSRGRKWGDTAAIGNPLPLSDRLAVTGRDEGSLELSLGPAGHRLLVTEKPFRMDLLQGRELLCSVNARGLLFFEHLRQRRDS